MLIDTHAHLWFPDYYPPEADQPGYYDDLEEVLARAKAAGVEKMIVPGTDIVSSQKAIELAKKYPGVIYASVGVHPEETEKQDLGIMIQDLRKVIIENSPFIVAVGEIGTDQYKKLTSQQTNDQLELFRVQCELALEFDLPVIIHTRNSLAEALQVLDALPNMPRGQFHCFSHDEEGVKQVLERGFYVSFCGNITWSKRVAKLVPLVPIDKLLLETDSPFMKPGERNEPMNVTITAQIISDLQGVTLKAISEQTTVNALRLFKL